MIVVWVLVVCVGLLIAGACLGLWMRLPKERPNKNWVPTAAEVVGSTEKKHPIVRFVPPGREGTSDIPAALRQRIATGKDLLVLLDPLNPVMPYQMDEWTRFKKLLRIVVLVGAVIVIVGVVGLVVTASR